MFGASSLADGKVKIMNRGMALSVTVSVLALHCQAYNRADYARFRDAGAPIADRVVAVIDGNAADAPPDAQLSMCGSTELDGGAGCTLSVRPDRPAGLPNIRAVGTKILAAHSIRFGPGGEWRTIGIDRDGLCTLAGAGPASCMSAAGAVGDGENGRDNSFSGSIAVTPTGTRVFDEARLNRELINGQVNFALRITDFGGENDSSINVDWLPIINGHRTTPPGPNGTREPVWDGTDRWAVDRRVAYQADRMTPVLTTNEGYTTCGNFVFGYPIGGGLRINSNNVVANVRLSNLVAVGRFSADEKLTMDISGVWLQANIFSDLRTFGVCPPPSTPLDVWTRLNQGIPTALDLLGSGNVSPNTPCNAMSVAFRVEFWPIQLDPDADSPATNADPCRDGGV